jgi:hypothetical protein
MKRWHTFLAMVLGLAACGEATSPNGSGFAAGTVDGHLWKADTAVAVLQDSTLALGAVRHGGNGRVDGFTAVVHGFRVPLQVELAGMGSIATAYFSDAPEGDSFLEPGPTQVTDSQYRGLLQLEALEKLDSTLVGTIAFATAPSPDFPSRRIAVHFRMRLVTARPASTGVRLSTADLPVGAALAQVR